MPQVKRRSEFAVESNSQNSVLASIPNCPVPDIRRSVEQLADDAVVSARASSGRCDRYQWLNVLYFPFSETTPDNRDIAERLNAKKILGAGRRKCFADSGRDNGHHSIGSRTLPPEDYVGLSLALSADTLSRQAG